MSNQLFFVLKPPWLRPSKRCRVARLDDPQQTACDVSNVGHWGTGDVEVKIDNIDQLEYALSLIQQAYRHTL